jgi:hypothetical protein
MSLPEPAHRIGIDGQLLLQGKLPARAGAQQLGYGLGFARVA